MSEENKDIEQVEAEVVEEGKKAVTLEDAPIAPEAPTPEFSEKDTAGTSYESTAASYTEPQTKVLGIISLVCGILSIVCCCGCYFPFITGIAGVVLGIISLKKEPSAKGMAIAGIACGAVGAVIGICGIIFMAAYNAAGTNVKDSLEFGEEFFDSLDNLGNL